MITSFRLRLALLSALFAGVALAAFGISTWWQIRKMKLDRIDNDVRSHAERETNRTRDSFGWQRTEANIVSEIGIRDKEDLLLLVEDSDGDVLYRSVNWPISLKPDSLPWPKRGEGKRPPNADARPRQNPPDSGATQQNSDLPPPAPPPATATASMNADGREWRMGLATSDSSRVVVAVDAASIDRDMKSIRNAFIVAMPFALALIGVGAWGFSRRSLRPIRELVAATRAVTAEGLDRRISVQGEDREFVELIDVYNGMLERLERSFQQSRRFSADAAHELKTPLAILQGQLEHAIQAAEDGSVMQSELTSILDEVRRLSTISRKLLLLSQADAGRLNIHCEPFEISKALNEIMEDARMLAPELRMESNIEPGITMMADGPLLEQVFHNLISNAIKYNVENGWLQIRARRNSTDNKVEVEILNSSNGIAPKDLERIFDRFYRVPSTHGERIEGVGLGLSVSREIARAHGGEIKLRVRSDNSVQTILSIPSNSLG